MPGGLLAFLWLLLAVFPVHLWYCPGFLTMTGGVLAALLAALTGFCSMEQWIMFGTVLS